MGPVVINEIMYHPPDLSQNPPVDNERDEYIELLNISVQTISFYDFIDMNPWTLQGAVDYEFQPGTILGPGAYLLVVAFDPAIDLAWSHSVQPTVLAEM